MRRILKIIILVLIISYMFSCLFNRTNPLDPNNPNSDAILLPAPIIKQATAEFTTITINWESVDQAESYEIYKNSSSIGTTSDTLFIKNINETGTFNFQIASIHSTGLIGKKSNPFTITTKKGMKAIVDHYTITNIHLPDDSTLSPGDTVEFRIFLNNIGTETIFGVTTETSILEYNATPLPFIHLTIGSVKRLTYSGQIFSPDSIVSPNQAFKVVAEPNTPIDYQELVIVTIKADYTWIDSLYLTIK